MISLAIVYNQSNYRYFEVSINTNQNAIVITKALYSPKFQNFGNLQRHEIYTNTFPFPILSQGVKDNEKLYARLPRGHFSHKFVKNV